MNINRTYLINYPVDVVFASWISPKTIIAPAFELEIVPELGGIYKLIMPDGMSMNGKFLSFKENQYLHYTWKWDGDEEETEVQVKFKAHPEGTQIDITHSGFKSESSKDSHLVGWDNYVNGFREFLSK
jgi:uncharacterized protein YndB with AHSA1/START domain